jgi:3-hydroxybenzoate 6-monooxygenase
MAIEDAVCLADSVDEAAGDFPAAFQVYQAARYLRTARVQVMARVYGEVFHTSGVVRELRNTLLAGRTQKDALHSMDWLYSEQPGLGRTFPKRLPNPARLVEPAYGRGL